VRLRLAQARDAPAIRALLNRQGVDHDELEIARLVRGDPRRRLVICAMALIGSSETILGVGEIGIGPEATVAPTLLYVDAVRTEGLDQLLARALVGRAGALAA
jgi:ABC-type amino acid transport substrate-binding protein